MRNRILALAAAALITTGMTGCTGVVNTPSAPKTVIVTATPEPEPTVEESTFDYAEQNPTASLKTTDKQCFGEYGCNYVVEVELGMDDPDSVPADATGSVTYEITGAKDGSIMGTLDLSAGQYESESQVFTMPRGKEPKVSITTVVTD